MRFNNVFKDLVLLYFAVEGDYKYFQIKFEIVRYTAQS